MSWVETHCSHTDQCSSQRQKEDVGDEATASLSNDCRQHSSAIVQRLVLIKMFYKLFLIGLLCMHSLCHFFFFFLSSTALYFPPEHKISERYHQIFRLPISVFNAFLHFCMLPDLIL